MENLNGSADTKKVNRRRKTALAVNCVLAVVIAAELVAMGWRLYGRWDITANGNFTISDRTVKILRSIDEPVTATVFYSKVFPRHQWTWQAIDDLFLEFRLHTSKLEVINVDPYGKPEEAGQLRQKFGINENDFNDGVVVFEYKNKFRYVTDSRIVERPKTGGAQVPPGSEKKIFNGEDAFISTIVSLMENRQPLALFLSGHGESGIKDDSSDEGFGRAGMLLERDGFKVQEFKFNPASPSIPENADVLIITGPKAPLPEEHLHGIRDWVESGGRLMVMPSIQLVPGEMTIMDMNMKPLFDYFGVRLGDKLIVEEPTRVVSRESVQMHLVTSFSQEHTATKGMGKGEDHPVVFGSVRGVFPEKDVASPVVLTSPTSVEKGDLSEILDPRRFQDLFTYGKSVFNPARDTRGPFPIVTACEVASTGGPKPARAVFTGTNNFATNPAIQNCPFNGDLFMNLVNWLVDRETHIGIAGKPPLEVSYHVRPYVARRVFWLVIVIMPLAALAAGIFVWVSRRT